MKYLVSVEDNDPSIRRVLVALGARQLAPGAWITLWDGVAVTLCKTLRVYTAKPVVACCLDTADWTYLSR
jgi:hypothetical protein